MTDSTTLAAGQGRKLTIALLAVLLLAAIACTRGDRPRLGMVHGTVTFDGKPLVRAMVIFRLKGSRASTATTDDKGQYTLMYLRDIEGAVVGPHVVQIVTSSEESPEERLPARYNRDTELRAEVKPGNNVFDFHLQR